MNQFKTNYIQQYIYFFGLALVAMGLPFSKIAISTGEIILVGNWLLDKRVFHKFYAFFTNKTALIISSVVLLHFIGLIYSTDYNYAFKDIRIKFPIFIFALIISTSEPLDKKKLHLLLSLFVLAVTVSTFISTYIYFTKDIIDIRNISIFISHIRFGLFVCFSVFILMYFIFYAKKYKIIQKILFLLVSLWLIAFLIILESVTGIVVLIIISVIILIVQAFKVRKKIFKIVFVLILVLLFFYLFNYVKSIYEEINSVKVEKIGKLDKLTVLGNRYDNDTIDKETENGHYVWIYICESELKKAWEKRSKFNYDSTDRKGQMLKYTLIHFLTSRGLHKDAIGVNKLTDEEVHSIEKGINKINYNNHFSIHNRIYEVLLEYKYYLMHYSPNGHSLMMRLEYWKASVGIIKNHLLFGVGTGDLNKAFENQYKLMKSPLDKKWRLRSHNQYLSIAVAFGIIGLLWFLFTLLYPLFNRKISKDYLYLVFFAIIMISMLTEDTIETQVGLTFFAFFNTLFLTGRKFLDK